MTNKLLSATSINKDNVVNASGENLGEIKDLMVDPEDGRVVYAVLSFGGILGLGDKYFAVPFERMTADRENKRMVLNVDKKRLESAPGFAKDNWPDFADPTIRQTVNDYYMPA